MSDEARRALADFLRVRRSRVQPQDVGLEPGPRRRVAGLRREELALLAGVSPDYYQRMEQGRDVRPSDQVLDAIARALHFSEEESRHLHTLASAARKPPPAAGRYSTEEVAATTKRLLHGTPTPAMVISRFLDVLAGNPLADAVLGAFTDLPRDERNLLTLLLRPEANRNCPDWGTTIAELTAMLRTQVAAEPNHPRAVELVGRLSELSATFVSLWSRHDVDDTTRGHMRILHPLVDELRLDWDAYPVPDSTGQMLIVFTTEPGSVDDHRLQRLKDLLPTGAAPVSPPRHP
ncbi:helix-turn-helix transcriptional regulator [Amycolatopsis sp. PS_44_ISF1]|uniref:helix-turn-helix transcriptional regulator n=1 Tax=Amycolatopsis sp. PS_44_ISF1 TaxID=2974917 RepID=UPI0028DE5E1A|nr:helix-turn-helix transcriptional regulator [Amycolatopsis sp. PS_44_ISF1]MDT8912311.1 helix-turn-helix transcriptional regulator [Amycolatopsis sp. PS_44_ISF1]